MGWGVVGFVEEKFCKTLNGKCSENCDYRYTMRSHPQSSIMNIFIMNTAWVPP